QQQSKKHHAADAEDYKFDVSELLGKIGGECGFSFRLGFMRGIGKFFVNGLGHADGIVRVIEPEDVPSRGALDNAGNVLVKVFPLEPELTLVSVRLLGVIDAIEVELPDCAAVK